MRVSLTCLLRPPFDGPNQAALSSKIRLGRFNRVPVQYSEDINRVIRFLLQTDVKTIHVMLKSSHACLAKQKADCGRVAVRPPDQPRHSRAQLSPQVGITILIHVRVADPFP